MNIEQSANEGLPPSGPPAPDASDPSPAVIQMREAHHRVLNGLNLIFYSLQQQAHQSQSPDARRTLELAAQQIGGLARLHRHLHRGDPTLRIDVQAYLAELAADLQLALLGHAAARRIELAPVGSLALTDDELVTAASIITELVTNAVKHGAGDIAVSLQRAGGEARITVQDQGPGLPPGFDPQTHGGFGLRRVAELCARTGGALAPDRSVPFGRIVATMGVRAATP